MIGQQISQYKILKKIGEGGMGEVYLAEDSKLKRKVALKFLPQEFTQNKDAVERFQREAQAAAALNHPNIVTIHEINEYKDQTYITMEYVEGKTLKEHITNHQLPITKILDITTQLCEGLAKAHEAGIVHRDIKPQNILIDKDGRVKILDFGLAKLRGVGQLTKESSTLGTVNYMSPEQAMGKEVDHRTDIWSLGVVFYEMLTGQLPFKGDYEQAVIYSVINEKPQPLSSLLSDEPKELENLVYQMLEKKPDQRFQQVSDIIPKLDEISNTIKYKNIEKKKIEMTPKYKKKRSLFTGILALIIIALILIYIFFISKPTQPIGKSIAVLPFKNMSQDQQNEYFCDGITEDIITQLSKINDLKVTSRTSVFYFKNKEKKIKDIARELGVATILEGSVRQTGGKVRITAQLINATTDDHLWADTYDRELQDIFTIQSDVAGKIAKTLRVTMFPETTKRIDKKPTENIEAYQYYLRGKYYWNRRTPEDLKRAITFFEKAIHIDPEFAMGYSGLAETYVVIGDISSVWGVEDKKTRESVYTNAEEYCLKAISLDNELAQPYAALGEVKSDWEWDFQGAESAYKQALQLNPNYATAHQWLAEYYAVTGKIILAQESIARAQALDPFSFVIQFIQARIYMAERRYEESIKILKKILTNEPNFEPGHVMISIAYMFNKSYERALHHAGRISAKINRDFQIFRIQANRGNIAGAEAMLKDYLNMPGITDFPGALAIIYGDLGNVEEAVKWYKKAIKKRSSFVLIRNDWARCDKLNNDPRVKEMLKEVGLE